MKKSLIILSALSSLLLTSCNSHFNYSNKDIEKAVMLDSAAQIGDKLIIDISSPEPFFKEKINKKNILVAPRVKNKDKITFKDIKNNSTQNFSFDFIDESNISITLDKYVSTTYYVFFEKSASKKDKIALAATSTFTHQEKETPIFDLVNEKYYMGEEGPSFTINYDGVEVKDTSEVSFLGAFKELDVSEVTNENNSIKINTTDIVSKSSQGIIVLEQGFFKDIDRDIYIYSDVISSSLLIDQTSYKYAGTSFNFNITSNTDTFSSNIKKEHLVLDNSLDKVSVNDISKADEHKINVTLSIKDGSFTKIDELLEYLNDTNISVKNPFKSFKSIEDVTFNVDYPSLKASVLKDDNALSVYLRIYNATFDKLAVDDFKLNSVCLKDPNFELTDSTLVSNGLNITYSTGIKHFDGAYEVDNIKTLWGEDYLLKETFDVTAIDSDEIDVDKIINNPISYNEDMKGVDLSSFLNKLDAKINKQEKYGNALTSMEELLSISGITYRVKSELNDFINQIYASNASLNKEGIIINAYLENKSNEQLIRLNNKWEAFNSRYVDKMEEMISNYKSKFLQKIYDLFVGEPLSTKIVYVDAYNEGEDALKASIMHPNKFYTSIDGYEVYDMYAFTMLPGKHPEYIKETLNNLYLPYDPAEYYTKAIEDFLLSEINNSLYRQPEIIEEDVIPEVIFSSIKADALLNIINASDVKVFTELYKGYLAEIAKEYDDSILTTYFNMLSSYANFQNEIEEEFSYFLMDMKFKTLKYGSFLQLLNLFSLIEDDYTSLALPIKSADNALMNYQYLDKDDNYSYVTKNNIKLDLVKLDYENSFDKSSNSLTNFTTSNALTNEKMDDINNTSLLSNDDLLEMYNRYLFLNGVHKNDDDYFMDYLVSNGLLTREMLTAYRTNKKDDATLPILTKFNGAFLDTSSSSFDVTLDKSNESTELFKKDEKYAYGQTGDKSHWAAKESSGVILDLGNMKSSDTVINRYASYNDNFWSNPIEEHHLFKMYEDGYYCFIFYRS